MISAVRPLVLIGGWGCRAEAVAPLAEALHMPATVIDLQKVMLSLGSEPSAARNTLLQAVASPSVLCGWSTGGMLALEFAAEYPSLCAAVVLISSTACFCETGEYEGGVARAAVRAMQTGLRREPVKTLQRFYELAGRIAATAQYDSPDQDTLRALDRGLSYLAEADLRNGLSSVTMPVLLLHGTRDAVIPFQASVYLHEHLPRSELELFSDCSHALVTDRPHELSERIDAFLKAFLA